MRIESIVFFVFIALMFAYFVFSFLSLKDQTAYFEKCEASGGVTIRTLYGLACADKLILKEDK